MVTVHCYDDTIINNSFVFQIIVLTSAFCFVMSLYESLEYMLCYNDEKKEHKRQLLAAARQHRQQQRQDQIQTAPENSGESTRLLDAEEIPLQTLPPQGRSQSKVTNTAAGDRGYSAVSQNCTRSDDRGFGSSKYGSSNVSSNDNNSNNLHILKTVNSSGAGAGTASELSTRELEDDAGDTLGTAGSCYTGAKERIPNQPLLRHNDVRPELMMSQLLSHIDVPQEVLTSLTPDEIRLNMMLTDSSDEEILFEAKTS